MEVHAVPTGQETVAVAFGTVHTVSTVYILVHMNKYQGKVQSVCLQYVLPGTLMMMLMMIAVPRIPTAILLLLAPRPLAPVHMGHQEIPVAALSGQHRVQNGRGARLKFDGSDPHHARWPYEAPCGPNYTPNWTTVPCEVWMVRSIVPGRCPDGTRTSQYGRILSASQAYSSINKGW